MLDLTKEEIDTLYGILKTESVELKDLIKTADDADKKSLKEEYYQKEQKLILYLMIGN